MPRAEKKGSAAGRLAAGISHFNAGRYDAALAAFRAARVLGARNPELDIFIAHALNSTGRPQEGLAPVAVGGDRLAAMRKALARDPRNAGARRALIEGLRLRGQRCLSEGDPKRAEASLAEALRWAQENRDRSPVLDVLRSCGLAHLFANRWDEAEAVFRRLLKANPRDARAWHGLAGVMRGRRRPRAERDALARALRADRGELAGSDRFRALMKLGRYKAAVAEGERVLDGKPTVNDLRIFWDPWEWDDRLPREARRAELKRFERTLGAKSRSPWLHYYRAELLGPEGMGEFERITAYPAKRYGWMFAKAGLAALCEGQFPRAETWFKRALSGEAADWRTHCFLAETYLCLGRTASAFAELKKAAAVAPEDDKGQVLAWRGAVDLWLGDYAAALKRLDEACALDAQCAFSWRAAALLKLGRRKQALAELDRALERFPRDFEAYVWRGEAKRELGLYSEALKDFNEEGLAYPRREPPIWMWALVNRALTKAALGDRAGLEADFAALPGFVIEHVKNITGLEDKEKLLRAALKLGRGFRREEYRQAIWMR